MAVDAARPAAEAKGLSLVARAWSGAGTVMGDPGSAAAGDFQSVCRTPRSSRRAAGAIVVRVRERADAVELSVVDTGHGIDAESAAAHLRSLHSGRQLDDARVRAVLGSALRLCARSSRFMAAASPRRARERIAVPSLPSRFRLHALKCARATPERREPPVVTPRRPGEGSPDSRSS